MSERRKFTQSEIERMTGQSDSVEGGGIGYAQGAYVGLDDERRLRYERGELSLEEYTSLCNFDRENYPVSRHGLIANYHKRSYARDQAAADEPAEEESQDVSSYAWAKRISGRE